MGFDKAKVERILLTSFNQMPHAIDEVNTCTILSLMVKLNIQSPVCVERVVPFCYRISDLARAIACCHMISMVNGSKNIPLARAFAVHVAQLVPLQGHVLSLKDLGRLCEALSAFELYCHGFGEILIAVIRDDLHSINVKCKLYITSVLLYLGRMGLGDISLWRLYSQYTSATASRHQHSTLIKALEAFLSRNTTHCKLFKAVGDILAEDMDLLYPLQVAQVADIYARSNFHHEELIQAVIENTERIILSVDKRSTVKLLRTFLLAYGGHSRPCRTPGEPAMPQRHRRGLYMVLTKCASNINLLELEDLLTVATAMKAFPNVGPKMLEASIMKLAAKDTGKYGTIRTEQRTTVQRLSSLLLGRYRERHRRVAAEDIAQLADIAGIRVLTDT